MESMMKRLIKRGGRTILAGAGLCLASMTGCQSAGTQFAGPWNATHPSEQPNAMVGMMPSSPAFSRVQAGQNLPMMQSGMMQPQMMAGQGFQPGMMQPQMMTQQPMMGQPIMGSGGMVYPVNYQPGQQPMMSQPQQMMPQQGMTYIPQPQPSNPAIIYPPSNPVVQGAPNLPAPQPGVTVTQGPNGPITVTTEIIDQPPTGTNPGSPVTLPPTMVTPAGLPAGGQPATLPPPTFNAPAPYTVPLPEAPNLAPVGRTPELLPTGVSKTPTGPTLPGLNPPAGLGNYPAVPVGHQVIAPPPTKLPSPTGPAAPAVPEDDIPAAPIFVPSK